MASDLFIILLSVIMGASIFVALPLVFYRGKKIRGLALMNALAIGIIFYIIMDVYESSAVYFAEYTINTSEIIYAAGLALSFLLILAMKNWRTASDISDTGITTILIAAGIGLQNLTEGLLLGESQVSTSGYLLAILFIGFTLQNATEGFAILSTTFSGARNKSIAFVGGALLIGGMPTVPGAILGLMLAGKYYLELFNSLATGVLMIVIFEMFSVNMHMIRNGDGKKLQNITYIGILAGILLGFIVNVL